MKLLFAHGTRVYKDKYGNKYTDGAFNMDLWSRYLKLSSDFTAILRSSDIVLDDTNKCKYSIVDETKIALLTVPDLIKPKKNIFNIQLHAKYHDIIKNAVRESDAIIVRLPSGIGETVVKYAKKYKKPYMVESVGDIYTAYKYYGNVYGKILAPIKRMKNRKLIKNAPYVNYVSATFLQERYPTKGAQIGCPDVVLDMPQISVLENRIRHIVEENREIILGLIGVLSVDYRGHGTALKTVNELRKRGHDVKIRFLGAGEITRWKRMSEELDIQDNVEFCGALPGGRAVLEWIDEIDVLIMPTKQETLGRAIIEAMSRGCPVVGSKETAIGEQIGSDCLASADDYIHYADIIEKMILSREYMKYCAQENFYRSFKYTNLQTNIIRDRFYKKFFVENGFEWKEEI